MLRSLAVMLLLVLTANAYADVRVTRRSQFTSDDPAFRRIPKELLTGQEHTVIVKGDRMMKINGPYVAELVDLREERIYALDLRRKTYSSRTFAELRAEHERLRQQTERVKADIGEQMRKYRESEARLRAEQEARASGRGRPAQAAKDEPVEKTEEERMREFVQNYEHTSGPTGQRRSILGFDAQEVVSTTRVGPTDDNPFGTLVSTTQWLADISELREIDEFENRLREATGELAPPSASAYLDMSAVTAAMQANPSYAEMITRISVDDSVKGAPVLMITRIGPAVDVGASDGAQSESKGGGILGALRQQAGRSLGVPQFGRRDDKPVTKPIASMTTQQEIVNFSRTVSAEEVAIPGDFKEVKARGR